MRSGIEAERRAVQIDDLDTPLVDLQLAPGHYFVTSYQRPCDLTCEITYPPVDRCTSQVEVAPGDDVVFTVEVASGDGCRLV
jgi:hypothetical protein